MSHTQIDTRSFVLGQKVAFAKAALLTGVVCYLSMLGVEKGLLAIAFALLALRAGPAPRLSERRGWAWLGLGLGVGILVLVAVFLLLYHDRFGEVIAALERVQ